MLAAGPRCDPPRCISVESLRLLEIERQKTSVDCLPSATCYASVFDVGLEPPSTDDGRLDVQEMSHLEPTESLEALSADDCLQESLGGRDPTVSRETTRLLHRTAVSHPDLPQQHPDLRRDAGLSTTSGASCQDHLSEFDSDSEEGPFLDDFEAGSIVRLVALSNAKHLNGKVAVVINFDNARERYAVKELLDHCKFAVRDINMELVDMAALIGLQKTDRILVEVCHTAERLRVRPRCLELMDDNFEVEPNDHF
jgi:hypothetical protein